MNAEKSIDNLLKVIGYVRPAGVAIFRGMTESLTMSPVATFLLNQRLNRQIAIYAFRRALRSAGRQKTCCGYIMADHLWGGAIESVDFLPGSSINLY
jgi:hypothetical protein